MGRDRWVRGRATEEAGVVVANEKGISDANLEVKWRFYEKEGLSFAIKPGLTAPTGDENKGLGAGKIGYSAYFITTKETDPWAFHLNLGYRRNENKADERKDLLHVSLATEFEARKDLKLVANVGFESNPDNTANTDPAFALGGVIYSIKENLNIDFGLKMGLNKAELDYSLLAGLAYKF